MPLQLVPLQGEAAGNGFVLRIQSALAGAGVEFLAIDQDDRIVIRTVVAHVASAKSLCKAVIDIIKRCDPTTLIVVDIDVQFD